LLSNVKQATNEHSFYVTFYKYNLRGKTLVL